MKTIIPSIYYSTTPKNYHKPKQKNFIQIVTAIIQLKNKQQLTKPLYQRKDPLTF